MNRNRLLGIGAGIVLGAGGFLAVQGGAISQADAAPSASAQLKINQRISQAAVRRSNDALAKIASLTAQVAALQVQAGAGPIWGVSNGGNQESLVTGRGGSGITSIYSNQAGRYTVKFDRNIAACSYSATIAADDQTKLTAGRDIRVALDLGDAARTQLTVFTSRANGNSVNSPFHIQVFC